MITICLSQLIVDTTNFETINFLSKYEASRSSLRIKGVFYSPGNITIFLRNYDKLKQYIYTGDPKSSKNACDAEIGSWSVRKRFGKLRIVDSVVSSNAEEITAPPRPPKPTHMLPEYPSHNYSNLDGATESSKPVTPATPVPLSPIRVPSITATSEVITDETYDFPRSHQPDSLIDSGTLGRTKRNCYSNAAPSNNEGRIFRYDFYDEGPSSIPSESSAMVSYSNLSSPLLSDSITPAVPTTMAPPPPVVYRELKPGRKGSDTLSLILSNDSFIFNAENFSDSSLTDHVPNEPPNINRQLKPAMIRIPSEGTCTKLI